MLGERGRSRKTREGIERDRERRREDTEFYYPARETERVREREIGFALLFITSLKNNLLIIITIMITVIFGVYILYMVFPS